MREKCEDKKVKLLSITADVLGVISAAITIVPFIVLAKDVETPLKIAICVIAAIIIILIVRNFSQIAYRILVALMNLTAPDQPYKLNHKTVVYEFFSRHEMYHEKIFEGVALHNGVDHIDDKYKWTGNNTCVVEPLFPGQSIEILDNKYGMQNYRINNYDKKRVCRGQEIKMGMKIQGLVDPNGTSSLHLSSGVYEITDKLTLRVVFDNTLKPHNIRKVEYLHYTDDNHFKCSDNVEYDYDTLNDKKFVEWTIEHPVFGGRYVIDWSF